MLLLILILEQCSTCSDLREFLTKIFHCLNRMHWWTLGQGKQIYWWIFSGVNHVFLTNSQIYQVVSLALSFIVLTLLPLLMLTVSCSSTASMDAQHILILRWLQKHSDIRTAVLRAVISKQNVCFKNFVLRSKQNLVIGSNLRTKLSPFKLHFECSDCSKPSIWTVTYDLRFSCLSSKVC